MLDKSNEKEKLSRREREKAAHRKEIIDAAVKVFAEKGFHAATLEEIAQEAEFSKGALYLYFSSKEDLLYNILNYAFQAWPEITIKTITGNTLFRKELISLFNEIAKEIFSHPDIFTLISAQHATFFKALSDEKRTEILKIHDKFWHDFTFRVQKAIDNGELRDIKAEAIAAMIRGSLEAMINNRWDCETLDELHKGITCFMDILFNGIAKKKEI